MATSVPNTNTFSLQDVVNVVGGNNLISAFANSVDGCFDSAYKGSKNSLLNFRNYNALTTPIISISANFSTTAISATVYYGYSYVSYSITTSLTGIIATCDLYRGGVFIANYSIGALFAGVPKNGNITVSPVVTYGDEFVLYVKS